MKTRIALVAPMLCLVGTLAFGQTTRAAAERVITLSEAVTLALEHNHVVRLAALDVDADEHAKDVTRGGYFPSVRADSGAAHVSDTQLIEIPAGAFGGIDGRLVPPQSLILNQGGRTFASAGIGLVQPITQLLKVKAANDIARADVQAARGKARGIENTIALKVHELYYRILVAEARRAAIVSKIDASDDLQQERVQQVTYGAALQADLIESRAQSLQVKQELLTTDLQLSDLHMQFNDTIGLPLTTAVVLAPAVMDGTDPCAREECVRLALDAHPEVGEARAQVARAESAVRLAKYEYVPDVETFVRYSLAHDSPFLAGHFATVGIHVSYDVFDGGKRRAAIQLRETQLAQARESLARISDEVELRVQTAYNKLQRTRQMVAVSQELVDLRGETRRVAAEQLTRGATLRSSAASSLAQELEAKAVLLQSRLDFVQAADEMNDAIGRTPR